MPEPQKVQNTVTLNNCILQSLQSNKVDSKVRLSIKLKLVLIKRIAHICKNIWKKKIKKIFSAINHQDFKLKNSFNCSLTHCF